ncbi:hypothetical protein EDB81DRAFT_764962 [Dactylonectria macrodidyma]|uniref:Uncharacterized protein n=1 Tax=Dactylonectria macrodidyma TaxID=307937 RepID=A0A9P9IMF1_9HYPO|nr:hypothetical protein EDB81DRAFT_764962 [Dactylonectria macrodidyma]
MKLNAAISTAPLLSVIQEAKAMDEERANGHMGSRLHGMPIILKARFRKTMRDLMVTDSFRIETTSNSFALKGLKAAKDATTAIHQRPVGDIEIVGTQSSGAAFDSSEPIAESVEDCADVMELLLLEKNFRSHPKAFWNGINVAYLNYDFWQFPETVCEKTLAFDREHLGAHHAGGPKLLTVGRHWQWIQLYIEPRSFGALVTFDALLMPIPNITATYKTVEQA